MSSFLTEVKGFTPVIDIVVKDTSLVTAVVYGRIWRYCQMEDRVDLIPSNEVAHGIAICNVEQDILNR